MVKKFTLDKLNKTIKDLKEMGKLDTKHLSDTYHTFGDLYNHRMAFNSALCQALTLLDRDDIFCYKSWKHHDGTMFDNMFIVVIESPLGQISYHYSSEHWDKFDIDEFGKSLEYDGHTSNDTYERLLKLFLKINEGEY